MTRRGLEAWLDGAPVVVIGNVVENASVLFGPARSGGRDAVWLEDTRSYAPITTLLAPSVHTVVLTDPVDGEWLDDHARFMGWEDPARVGAATEVDAPLSTHALENDDLRALLRANEHPLLPWSPTRAFGELERAVRPQHALSEPDFDVSLSVARRADSKIGANHLFVQVATDHPGVDVADQSVARGGAELSDALRSARAIDRDVFVKAEFGQAGFASTLVEASDSRPVETIVGQLHESDERFRTRRVAVEERIPKASAHSEITVDVVVVSRRRVEVLPAAHMHIVGTHYEGVTLGGDALPDRLRRRAEDFAADVGSTLADDGYVGWLCVDYLHRPDGVLCPTEINARCTGSAPAHAVQRRRQAPVVRTVDHFALPDTMDPASTRRWIAARAEKAAPVDATALVPPTSRVRAVHTLGVVLTAPDAATVRPGTTADSQGAAAHPVLDAVNANPQHAGTSPVRR